MNKQQYLAALKHHLRGLPYDEITDILADLDEYFELGIASGRSEAEIAEGLGTPQLMALGLMTQNTGKEGQKRATGKGVSTLRLMLVFIGVGFSNLMVLPIFIAIAGVVFALFVTIFALYFSGGILAIAPILKMISASLVSTGSIPVGILPFLGVGLIYLTRKLHIGLNNVTKRFFAYGLRFTKYSWQAIQGN